VQPTRVDQLVLPIGLTGPLDNPRIRVDEKPLPMPWSKPAPSKMVTELRGKAEETITREVGDKLGDQGKGLLNNILGGQKRTNN
jgi:hypothetical protein